MTAPDQVKIPSHAIFGPLIKMKNYLGYTQGTLLNQSQGHHLSLKICRKGMHGLYKTAVCRALVMNNAHE